ncbi:ABC transporter ATP-binding protein [Candidatus Saganbacteria bacterium]|nr:ABC transporter ATP-binding protein [Candidatus Saganbacteria bacterium]
MKGSILEAKNIQKTYLLGKTELHALNNISLSLEQSELISLVGPSGSGKTTLLNILGCLDSPSSGQLFFQGQNMSQKKERELAEFRRTHFGYIFQFFNLIPVLTALENVAFPLWQTRLSRKEINKKASQILEIIGLGKFAHHKPDELSGGQQQRVAAARALISDPQIIFADEPTGNLDSQTGQQMMELLKTINKEKGTTVVIATHDSRVISQTRRIIEIKDGEIRSDEKN